MISYDVLPYNGNNKIVEISDLQTLLKNYSKINNIDFFRNAFVHRSYCTRKNENFVNGNVNCPINCVPLQEESNERLEFLGDAVLNLIIGKYLFDRYPEENEGFLTKMRTKLVNGVMLAHFAKILNIAPFIIISKQVEDNNGRENKNILEDCFEAILGAMFLDSQSNLDPVYTWLVNFIEENIDFSDLILSNSNYKDLMLKHFQHNFGYVPRFYALDTEIKNNIKVYYMCLKNKNGDILAKGNGNTKKQAENDCAKNALSILSANPAEGINSSA